jgi:hypothetical protein
MLSGIRYCDGFASSGAMISRIKTSETEPRLIGLGDRIEQCPIR